VFRAEAPTHAVAHAQPIATLAVWQAQCGQAASISVFVLCRAGRCSACMIGGHLASTARGCLVWPRAPVLLCRRIDLTQASWYQTERSIRQRKPPAA
jgi:hypothetical protein